MKKVLVLYYSQSGQLKRVMDRLTEPISQCDSVEITYCKIQLEQEFDFPWDKETFFNVFPESFKQIPQSVSPPCTEVLNTKYDLIVLGYQVWYLSPSIPINSFLKSSYAKTLFKDTPVVTVSGSRNMWVMAQQKIKILLNDLDSTLVGNIALVDRSINLVSVITIVDWMFSGKQRKVWGFLPKPGISDQEINSSNRFGTVISEYLLKDNYQGMQDVLVGLGAVEVRHFLVSMDRKANKMFKIWSSLIYKSKKRKTLLKIFNYYLFIAIWLISPIVHIIHLILYPINYGKIKKDERYFKGID
ncbi:dialkylresorcinol condensing enzyme DarA [Myroides sp. M-43]|uniref:flavodoxin n=1 Tax=Myroides oncorhynchi TaxID=2893756 RepID=UPI001E5A681E|nr:flavodoxin [Myroides oncorhynchi]MCC9042148.1 dialkylresorcinol condensing enzyme DarA [Myroides oncorhynchi]